MKKIIIVGGGAAGMLAAITAAADNSIKVFLIEKMEKLGRKIFITGKGRCNLTNVCDTDKIFDAVVTNPRFLYSAIYSFDNIMTVDFFNKLGLKTKVERGCRVFPESDHSSDVIGVLKNKINKMDNITVLLNTPVMEVLTERGTGLEKPHVTGVSLKDGSVISADKVILATGGVSYPLTGSTGDGICFAKNLGHEISRLQPSLVPFNLKEDFCRELMGLSLKNVRLKINCGKRVIFEDMGEMLFTHFGISGPLVIRASAYIHKYLEKDIDITLDLKPALTTEQLDNRLLRDFDKYKNKDFRNSLNELLPSKLIGVIINRSGIDPFKKVNSITREERQGLVQNIKSMKLTFAGLRDFDEAIITKGGVSVKNINPSTMESKLIDGLYFAGEMIDVDALTGGFNLQIAWSTGYLAGISCIE